MEVLDKNTMGVVEKRIQIVVLSQTREKLIVIRKRKEKGGEAIAFFLLCLGIAYHEGK